jgi:hypothetical protein|tara:strand:- start:402 stop:701 length:300 start_codon:yes stop_codon:yes gene_type:complete
MKYILIQHPGFKDAFLEQVEVFKKSSPEDLIDSYNKSVKTGIVGVYAQAIMLVALRHVIKECFGVSPIKLEDNTVLSLTEEVVISDGKLIYSYSSLEVE